MRLYGLRNWVEQQYKQVKHSLGWSQYQVRSDVAMRRHWALVQGAFAFCWWAETGRAAGGGPGPGHARPDPPEEPREPSGARGEKASAHAAPPLAPAVALLAGGAAAGARLAGTGLVPVALLAGVERPAATAAAASLARLAHRRPSPRSV